MRLLIRAVSLAGQPLTQPITGIFDDRGGTIGRADTCTLMLPDPERHISRVQAEVRCDERGYAVRNVSHANPIVVNGSPVPSGRSVLLADGDDLQIGSYLLRVDRTSQATGSLAAATPSAAPPPPAAVLDPFAALWASPAPPASSLPPARSPFDDLGGFELAPPPPAALPSGFDLGSDLGFCASGSADPARSRPSAGLDDLFDLRPSVTGSDAVEDFLQAKPARMASPAAGEANPLDPLAMFSAAPLRADTRPVSQSGLPSPDRTPELHGSMPLPQARAALPAGGGMTQLFADVKSWAQPQASTPQPAPPPAPAPAPALAPVSTPAPAPAEPAPVVAKDSAAAVPVPPAADPLWSAFCEGAGIGLQPPGGLTPALMRVIGQMLRRSVDGTVQLVAARATTKAELHAQVTMIQPRNNNPLKFSPDGRMALEQLLQPPLRGFLAGPAAIDRAMDDLVGHTVGTMAGMRAALDGVLDRFAPDQLEAKLSRQSMLDSVLPMHRRARLWELYLQHFQSVSSDAKDDFHSLFGKAFLQAYEEQLDRLDASRQPGDTPSDPQADGVAR